MWGKFHWNRIYAFSMTWCSSWTGKEKVLCQRLDHLQQTSIILLKKKPQTALFRCQLHISSTFASWTHALGWQPGIRWTFPSQNKTSGNSIFSIKSSNISLPGSTAKYSCGPYGYFRSPSGEVYYRLVAYWCMTSRQTSDWYVWFRFR